MRLDDAPESGNVEDRRGMSGGTKMAIGGGGSILLIILALVFGLDPNKLGVGQKGEQPAPGQNANGQPPNDKYKEFAGKVLGTLEDVWETQFKNPQNGFNRSYKKPKLVIFDVQVDTGCGTAPSAVGPFYCPADDTIYLDPTFFDELEGKLGGSKAEFSQAYVIAHENGHHVQNLLGYSRLADKARKTDRENEYSIRLELQADYLAGVWANQANKKFKILEAGDLEEAIKTALAIGDDKIQKKSRGWASPESFNHGTAKQRAEAFAAGAKTGDASKARLDRFFQVPFNPNTAELSQTPW